VNIEANVLKEEGVMQLTTVAEFIEILKTLPQDAIVADKHDVAINNIRCTQQRVVVKKDDKILYLAKLASIEGYLKDYQNMLKKAKKRKDENSIEMYQNKIKELEKLLANPTIITMVSI